MNYSDQMCDWLVEEGYTHCFFVAGGNIMHLLNSARTRFTCVPFVHEVAAGIAAEYFNESRAHGGGRAFALVTAGPGLTNIVTALAGAYLESRELLVVGGQVKSTDLARGEVRQRGIQEVDGVALAAPVCKEAVQLDTALKRDAFKELVRSSWKGRPGPVFLEVCLDVQGGVVVPVEPEVSDSESLTESEAELNVSAAVEILSAARRPVLLLGGGVARTASTHIVELARSARIPCATTWNGADRVASDDPIYAGRPNTWGMRWANLILQQADVIVAAGTRLGLQQTGFNWQAFAPVGKVIQIDIDPAELSKGHPKVAVPLEGDVNQLLPAIMRGAGESTHINVLEARSEWQHHVRMVRQQLPLADPENETASGFLDPFSFIEQLSDHLPNDSVIVPSSSGGAFTVTMQALLNRYGQTIVTDKGLASMGYGLAGAIGAALANPAKTTVLVEGDGGFSQNLQELGTLARQGLDVKIFIFVNEGYASIRMTQMNYFQGAYLGCDIQTGLGMPEWPTLFQAYGIPCVELNAYAPFNLEFHERMAERRPVAFLVPIDPAQTYYPKISSRVTESGSMESNPIHLMSPDLSDDIFALVAPNLKNP